MAIGLCLDEKDEERESEASLLPKYGYLVSLTKQIFGLGPPDQGNLGTNTSVSMFESSVLKLLTLYSLLLLLAILTIHNFHKTACQPQSVFSA